MQEGDGMFDPSDGRDEHGEPWGDPSRAITSAPEKPAMLMPREELARMEPDPLMRSDLEDRHRKSDRLYSDYLAAAMGAACFRGNDVQKVINAKGMYVHERARRNFIFEGEDNPEEKWPLLPKAARVYTFGDPGDWKFGDADERRSPMYRVHKGRLFDPEATSVSWKQDEHGESWWEKIPKKNQTVAYTANGSNLVVQVARLEHKHTAILQLVGREKSEVLGCWVPSVNLTLNNDGMGPGSYCYGSIGAALVNWDSDTQVIFVMVTPEIIEGGDGTQSRGQAMKQCGHPTKTFIMGVIFVDQEYDIAELPPRLGMIARSELDVFLQFALGYINMELEGHPSHPSWKDAVQGYTWERVYNEMKALGERTGKRMPQNLLDCMRNWMMRSSVVNMGKGSLDMNRMWPHGTTFRKDKFRHAFWEIVARNAGGEEKVWNDLQARVRDVLLHSGEIGRYMEKFILRALRDCRRGRTTTGSLWEVSLEDCNDQNKGVGRNGGYDNF